MPNGPIQMAAAAGAHVTATTRGATDYVASLGAEHVINVRTDTVYTPPGGYDVVIDTVSGETLEHSYPLLRWGGRLVTLQTPPDQVQAARFGITAMFFIVTADAAELSELTDLVEKSALRVTIAATFPLTDGAAAYASGSQSGRKPGKTVLTIA